MKQWTSMNNVGGIYYYPKYIPFGLFVVQEKEWNNSNVDRILQKKGWVFINKHFCEDFCQRLNKLLSEAM